MKYTPPTNVPHAAVLACEGGGGSDGVHSNEMVNALAGDVVELRSVPLASTPAVERPLKQAIKLNLPFGMER
ncbi:hypothetical protein EVAR_16097_1 [Eumeta japonica]|uniref:Uncharacterized protein n=1 Tax=Eumeta variegata TaxID=151549 RepID=A0A4C1UK22_EUMVA|nr:hypothetical protein EVAR_16097_1 [Eumeta japonica]